MRYGGKSAEWFAANGYQKRFALVDDRIVVVYESPVKAGGWRDYWAPGSVKPHKTQSRMGAETICEAIKHSTRRALRNALFEEIIAPEKFTIKERSDALDRCCGRIQELIELAYDQGWEDACS